MKQCPSALKASNATIFRRWLSQASAQNAGLRARNYQLNAASSCLDVLTQGGNAILPLPTGTGKTLISNLVARLWLRNSKNSRVLVIVPRRVLVSQYTNFAGWMGNDVEYFSLSDSTVRRRTQCASNLASTRLLITTPGLFANKARSGLLSPRDLSNFGMVVVDEFDEFLLPEYDLQGCSCRFDRAFQRSLDVLPSSAVWLLMSATSPLVEEGTSSVRLPADIRAAAELVRSRFQPSVVRIPRASYRRHIPVTRLKLQHVEDERATELNVAVCDEISMQLSVLENHTGPVDRQWVMTRIDGLAGGRIRAVRSRSGALRNISKGLTILFGRIRRFHHLKAFVYEDMTAGLSAERVNTVTIFDPVTDRPVYFRDRVRLRGLTKNFEHHPAPGGKAEHLLQAVSHEVPTVVMFRYVRLLQAVAGMFRRRRLEFSVLHGQLTSRERDASLVRFRNGTVSTLLITRDTGKRGLDLPQAEQAFLYSPKASEESTFQEASRIRSTTAKVKDCVMLCYGHTGERDKLARLIEQIRARSDRRYEIDDADGLVL